MTGPFRKIPHDQKSVVPKLSQMNRRTFGETPGFMSPGPRYINPELQNNSPGVLPAPSYSSSHSYPQWPAELSRMQVTQMRTRTLWTPTGSGITTDGASLFFSA
jgi:hypothetical protein